MAATVGFIALSVIALAAGFVWSSRWPVALSLVAILPAVVTLGLYNQRARASPIKPAQARTPRALRPLQPSELDPPVRVAPEPLGPARGDALTGQARRKQAAELFAQGLPQAEVAHELGIARPTVAAWHHLWKNGGG
jgi:hypothetical protein